MTCLSPTALALVFALAFVPVAEAGTIVFFDSYRALSANGQFFETTGTDSWTRSTNFNGPTSSQSGFHFSFIGEDRARGDGTPFSWTFTSQSVNARSSSTANGPVDIYSSMFTSFSLDSTYIATLDVSLQGDGDGFAEGFLFNRTTGAMVAEGDTSISTRSRLLYNGLLDPGIYDYYLFARVSAPAGIYDGRAAAPGDLQLQEFTPVPEPATMTLFGVGLAAAAWRRRKR